MHRSSLSLLVPLSLGLVMSTLACSPAGSGGSGGSTTAGSPSGGTTAQPNGGTTSQPNGGTTSQPNGGTTVQPNGGTTTQPNGGTTSQPNGGTTVQPSAGTTSNPGGNPAGNTGNPGGNTSNTGGAKTGGTTSNPGGTTSNPGGTTSNPGGTTSNPGGTTTASGGSTTGGSTTTSGGSTGSSGACAAGPNVISDFESGKGDMIKQGTPARSGWWYVYYPGSPSSPTKSGQTQTPAVNTSGPIAVAAAPDASSCNKYALHSTGSGFVGASQDYAGFGAGFLPTDTTGQVFKPYDTTAYTGVKFKIKTGSGTAPATYFEVLTQDTMSSAQGGLLGAEGNANDVPVGLHNNRGFLLNDPWIPGGITSTYQTITIPFGYLVSRWVPAPATSSGAACVAGGPKCQAPAFVPAHTMGIQFSFYSGDSAKGFPVVGTPGTYDIWVDDVQFTTDDSGLQTRTGFPLTTGVSVGVGSCISPQGPSANAKFLVPAYNQWKATFVKGGKVIRPENQNDTVSEGIAYGMMIAVALNDQSLFDTLYGTWKANATAGSLMTWCLGSGGGSMGTACATSGGSATDADEDAAYALLMAGKVWGGTYNASAVTMIGDIWSHDIDGTGTKLPKGGSNYGSPSSAITNASYFAPSMYRAFAAVDSGHDWAGIATASLTAVNGAISGSNGLIPAWCGSSCTVAASNGAATDGDYQYDS
ncbi:MAG: glycosyl hydrolase family 8, partial [Polyangia bacterium]